MIFNVSTKWRIWTTTVATIWHHHVEHCSMTARLHGFHGHHCGKTTHSLWRIALVQQQLW